MAKQSRMIVLRLPAALKKRLSKEASVNDMTLSSLMRTKLSQTSLELKSSPLPLMARKNEEGRFVEISTYPHARTKSVKKRRARK